jgi:hypothetical protein
MLDRLLDNASHIRLLGMNANHCARNPEIDHKKPKPPAADPPSLTSQNADNPNHPKKPQNSMMDAELATDRVNGSKS